MNIPYKTLNFYSAYDRFLFLVCDVPHLIKTTRNCWANSFGHMRSRKLWVSCCQHEFLYAWSHIFTCTLYQQINGYYISWQHLVDLYDQGKGSCRESPGLNMVHKLKKEHIRLTSYSKMKVNLAVQVRFYTNMSGSFMYYVPL